jgi:hypothetical protein
MRWFKSKSDVPFTQSAAILQTEKFTFVESLSGYRRFLQEDDGYRVYLEPDPTVEAIGRAVLEALDKSRFLDPRKNDEFFDAKRIAETHRKWHFDFMTRYGYKTKREAYKNMLYCYASRCNGAISIKPFRRDRPEYWVELPADIAVVISATKDPVTVGDAAKLAFSRCE